MQYDLIRLVVSDFHVMQGQLMHYPPNRFGYLPGGSQVFHTGDMGALESDPNYLCCSDRQYRIKLRFKDPQRLERVRQIFTGYGRGGQIVEETIVETPSEEDQDADNLAVV